MLQANLETDYYQEFQILWELFRSANVTVAVFDVYDERSIRVELDGTLLIVSLNKTIS
jgi:hypothetical protein